MNVESNPNQQEQLPMDLTDLMGAIQDLPQEYRQKLEQPLNRVVEYTRRRRRILNLIQEALSQLRMDMKYLLFDLEATRRERDSYKNALDEGEI
ncbi:MAG: transcriptional regulator [Planctomycetota bacterium]